MADHGTVCPWQSGPALAIGLRKVVHNPNKLLRPYLSNGMTAMDIGCGMGYFTLPMAEMVGDDGAVIAVDLQQEMLNGMLAAAKKKKIARITAHRCTADSLGIARWNDRIDFALLFMMLHEVPKPENLIFELRAALHDGGTLFFAEPIGHVGKEQFAASLSMMERNGFAVIKTPRVRICRAAVLRKV